MPRSAAHTLRLPPQNKLDIKRLSGGGNALAMMVKAAQALDRVNAAKGVKTGTAMQGLTGGEGGETAEGRKMGVAQFLKSGTSPAALQLRDNLQSVRATSRNEGSAPKRMRVLPHKRSGECPELKRERGARLIRPPRACLRTRR